MEKKRIAREKAKVVTANALNLVQTKQKVLKGKFRYSECVFLFHYHRFWWYQPVLAHGELNSKQQVFRFLEFSLKLTRVLSFICRRHVIKRYYPLILMVTIDLKDL